MADLRFTWDPAKARANLSKHGISFEEAETVFSDDNAILVPDPDHFRCRRAFPSHRPERCVARLGRRSLRARTRQNHSIHLGSPSNPI